MARAVPLVLTCLVTLSACSTEAGPSYGGEFVAEDDLLLLTPQVYIPAATQHDTTVGDAYLLLSESASQLNAWVLNPLRRLSPLIDRARADEGAPDGGGYAWGPYDDPIQRELAWQVWAEGDVTELRVRDSNTGEAFEVFWRVEVDGERQAMSLWWNADLIAELPELAFHLHDTNRQYSGSVTFDMATQGGTKTIDIAFDGFAAVDPGFGDFTFDPRDTLHYERTEAGAGSIAFARADPYSKEYGFTGPETDVLALESVWADGQSGYGRLTIAETGPENPDGDPLHGRLESQECFDSEGLLVWRDITAAYLDEDPDFLVGMPNECQGQNPWPAID